MRLNSVCAALVGILAFGQLPAFAASSLVGTIAEVFRFSAVMPLPVFENFKPAILPGSPIFGMPARSEPGAEVVDAGRIRTCNIPDLAAPIRRSTEGFLIRFIGAENIDELRLLFGLSEQVALSIDTYEVRLGNAASFTAPFDDVEKNFASAMKDKSCPGTQPAPPRMVVRTVVADVEVEFRGRQSLSAGLADKLRAAGAQNLSYSGDRTRLRFSLAGRLIALNVSREFCHGPMSHGSHRLSSRLRKRCPMKRYEYLPGNIAAFTLTEPRNVFAAASWSSKSDYCSINIPLSLLRPKQRNSTTVVHDFDLSLRHALGLKKAKADLQLEPNEIEILRKVEIRISSPKEYSVQKGLKPDYVQSCLAAMTGRTDIKRIRAILVGDVSVKVLFKDNVGFLAKTALLGKLQSNLGFGFLNGVSQDMSAENVVFAARLGPVDRKYK